MSSLKNKKIIISAGASGIGWATAKVCLDKGATVFICDIDEKYLAKSKRHKLNNKKLFIYKCDAIPMLKKNKGGSIINLSSGAGIMGFPLRSPYAASKWAIVGVTKTLAMELGKFKIRVNAICPGTIKGDRMVRVIRDKSKFLKISKKKIEKEFISMASMNCWIYEEDIGKTCSFLMSDDAARVSGQIIAVDGNAIRLD